jgi:DUF4097 and DUF4098 domain-containing protein YvlB
MHRSLLGVAAAVCAAALAGCGIPGHLNAEARDTWTRTYTLGAKPDVHIANVNGRVEVEGTDGATVEVHAERIAHAATDQLAHDLLPKIPINDRSTGDSVSIETGRVPGILIGASYEVRYRVKVPRSATVRATTVNGGVDVTSLSGRTIARTTNGGVRASRITGSLEARTVNGGLRAQFDALGPGDITLGVVNGGVHVSLPDKAKATVSATWVNGGFHANGLNFDVQDNGKRHFEGKLNGGGTQITATTVNGGITIGVAGQKDDGEDIGDVIEKSLHDVAP